jgi:hypothetical protein
MTKRLDSAPRRGGRALRPSIIRLEERVAPATFLVTQLADGLTTGTLRWAINQADHTPGSDTIALRPGIYTLTRIGTGAATGDTGALIVQGDVTIKGAGAGTTKVLANGLSDHVFHVLGGNVHFSGLTISGGTAVKGGGILVDSGNVSITNCVLSSNVAAGKDGSAGQGGALYQETGTLNVVKTTIAGNQAIGSAAPAHSVDIGGAGEGGGIYLNAKVTAVFNHVIFTDNIALGGRSSDNPSSQGGFGAGGAIRGFGANITISHSMVSDNRAIGGIGLDADVAILGGEVFGGGISVQRVSLVNSLALDHTIISGNLAQGGAGGNGPTGGAGGIAEGGGVFVAFGSAFTSKHCTIRQNLVEGGNAGTGDINPPPATRHQGGDAEGGGVFLFIGSNGTLVDADLLGNVARGGRGGDGVYGGAGGTGAGGAFWAATQRGSASTLRINGSLVAGNQAVGGALGKGTTADGAGGAGSGGAGTLGSQVSATIRGTQFNNNRAVGVSAATGGALDTLTTDVSLAHVTFRANLALGGPSSFGAGGAIHAAGGSRISATGVVFLHNEALGGNGVDSFPAGSGQGGAVFLVASKAEFAASQFLSNQALGGEAGTGAAGDGLGGAVQALNSDLLIRSSVLDSNQAIGGAIGVGTSGGTGDGGALYSDPAGKLTISQSKVTRNKALGASGYGGGIFLKPPGQGTVRQVKFAGNAATTAGSDIFGPFTT